MGLCKVEQFCELHFVPHRCCSRGTPQIPNGLPPVLRPGKADANSGLARTKKRRTNTCKTLRGLCKVEQFCELHFVPHRCCSRGTPQIPNGLPPVLRPGKADANSGLARTKKRRTNTCKTLRGLCKVGQFCELHFVPHRCCSRGTPQIPNGLPPVLRRWGKMEALVWLDDGKNVPVLAAASKQGSGHIKDGVAGLEVPSPFLCLSAFLVCVVFSFFSARSSLRARARSHLRG